MKYHLCTVLLLSTALSFVSPARLQAAEDNVIARVGDQSITYSEINTMMNSSAVVGLSVPALGTPERQRAHVMLLDKVISANLLYLDALAKGTDKNPVYQQDLREFSDGVLASLYRKSHLYDDIQVTDEEIEQFGKESLAAGTAVTDDVRTQIEATLRKRKLDEAMATERDRLRTGIEVSLNRDDLAPADDDVRADSDILARYGKGAVTWGESEAQLRQAARRSELAQGRLDAMEQRVEALNRIIDIRILADKARAEAMESDPVYRRRLEEYRKTHLINLQRSRVLAGFEPDDKTIDAYFDNNRKRIDQPEQRKIQMVVLKTREEADSIRSKIESGELTLFQAAAEYSIDPRAKESLGDMGWVTKGTGFPELDKLTFSLGPDELGGPVESPAGWHLVKVLDVRDAQFEDIHDENTRKFVRRTLMREKLNDYLVDLRLNHFKVEVDEARLNDLFKREAEWIAELEKKAQQPSSITAQREEQLKQLLPQP